MGCLETCCRHLEHCSLCLYTRSFSKLRWETDLQVLAKSRITNGVAMQVGVDWPSVDLASRVALTVAQNMAQKAQERLKEAQRTPSIP